MKKNFLKTGLAGLAVLGLGLASVNAAEIRVLNWKSYGTDEAWAVKAFTEKTGHRMPDGKAAPSPAFCVDYDFVLAREE